MCTNCQLYCNETWIITREREPRFSRRLFGDALVAILLGLLTMTDEFGRDRKRSLIFPAVKVILRMACNVKSTHLSFRAKSRNPDTASSTMLPGVVHATILRMRDGNHYTFWVYIMASRTGTLYVGVTGHFNERIFQHKTGVTEGFTKKYGCESSRLLRDLRLHWKGAGP